MSKTAIWLEAARLRTLPLSVSGIIIGNGLAFLAGNFSWLIFLFCLLTTIAFQVLSNFANDYGDGVKGTDNDARLGPQRVLQQGLLSRAQLKRGIQINVVISLLLALTLIVLAFDQNQWMLALLFLLLGIASVVAAIKYTVGKNAYGYRAMGDLFVFLFFGCLSVMGSHYLQTKSFETSLILPSVAVGCLSVAVLNLNNLRDMENDKVSNKITLPLLLGFNGGKRYHYLLFFIALTSSLSYTFYHSTTPFTYLYLVLVFPLGKHLYRVKNSKGGKSLDSELKVVALSTFFYSLLFVIGFLISS